MNRPPEGLAPKSPPTWARWTYHGYVVGANKVAQYVWSRGPLVVLSSLILADFHGEQRWQWLVSASVNLNEKAKRGAVVSSPIDVSGRLKRRATDAELDRFKRDFGLQNAEEDNHSPGCARMFFLLCDAKPTDPVACECKETEEVVVEPDGFTWSKGRNADADQARAAAASMQLIGRLRE